MPALTATAVLPEKLYQRGNVQDRAAAAKREFVTAYNVGMWVNLWHTADHDLGALAGLRYVHYPMRDGKHELHHVGALEAIALDAAGLMDKRAVVVQCFGGKNRSGLLAALIVRHYLKVSGSAATQIVLRARPKALSNPYFCAYLDTLAAP